MEEEIKTYRLTWHGPVSDKEFEEITRHFVAPDPAEGFEIVIHRSD